MLDCDATLRTDLAVFATIGESKPENLVHFVFEDITSLSTDGLPVRGLDNVDFQTMARGAGYANTYRFSDLEELLLGLESVIELPGSYFGNGGGDEGPRAGSFPGARHGGRLG